MPGPVQLGDLVTRVRRRADMERTGFVTDSEIQEYIEQSLGDLFDLVIANHAGRHWIASTDAIETLPGVAAYTNLTTSGQPTRIYKLLGVDIEWAGEWRTARPGDQWNDGDEPRGWTTADSVRYWFYQPASVGDVLEATEVHAAVRFTPTPAGVHRFRLRYVPYPNDWSAAPLRYFQGYTGWDEYIVCDAAAKCLEKEESFEHAATLIGRRDKAAERIRWASLTMDASYQGRVRDVEEEAARRGRYP